ncbi:MAG: FAD-dependent oxidoreductase [Deltaproteobacteria bacterium]|nr:FAD-dependent oxidoreductase [Deltaproteobacteria bacterium]
MDKRESRPCKANCIQACPINTNVPGYLRLIRDRKPKEAYILIRSTNPLPSTCARVCYAPCEDVCNRGDMDYPIAIRHLKRFAVDNFTIEDLPIPVIQKNEKKVAIIGAGPAGLACAHDLAVKGYNVTVFEAETEPGGMLRYAIPEYRLPKSELRREIQYIRKLGVEFKCNTKIGQDIGLPEIIRQFNAVFIAVGAQKPLKLNIEGEKLDGVLGGIDFLKMVHRGEKVEVGKRCVVIGGGNTAVDCARVALRLGAQDVKIVYRRSREEMPASEEEIDDLIEEGVKIEFLTSPKRFIGRNGKVSEIECVRMELGEPEKDGRRKPIEIVGSNFMMPVDTVIVAVGQIPDTSFIEGSELSTEDNGTLKVDNKTKMTSLPGVFAGGDVVTGPKFVVDAIAHGKKAAINIDRYLRGEELQTFEEEKITQKLTKDEILFLKEKFGRETKVRVPKLEAQDRKKNFFEVMKGYNEGEAILEAQRCLASKIEGCIECGECDKRCEVKAINHEMKDEIIEKDFDALIVATGFDIFDPSDKKEYGYGKYNNVITSIEFERLSSVTGPTGGDIVINGKIPKRFFFIQCVGSRDNQIGARFCSRVCCMYTAKHATIVKDRIKDSKVYVSYIDMRAYGKGYEEFYKSVQEEGVIYIRGIPGEVIEGRDGLIVRVEDILSGELREIEVDVVVLACGIRPKKEIFELSRITNLELDEYGFVKTESHSSSITSVQGIFVCGMAEGPKDIPDTVAQAGEAVASCLEYLL